MLGAMDRARRELPTIPAQRVERHVDGAIARVAGRQHGVISRGQLRELGIKDSAIGYRVAAGRLHRLHRGVYAVGHRVVGMHGRWMAATLACGPGAALSHASAAALWDLRPSAATTIDVSVSTAGGRNRAGLRIHRHPGLRPGEIIRHHGIPVTTPSRTILDLAATLNRRQLERALDQAEIQELTDMRALDAIAQAHPGHRGARKLTAALATHTPGTTLTRSELEERFLDLCRVHGLPRPHVNATAAGLEVDFLFAKQRLIVETDGWRYHRSRSAFERDRRRDATLTAAGYRTLRLTHRQLTTDHQAVARALRVALGLALAA